MSEWRNARLPSCNKSVLLAKVVQALPLPQLLKYIFQRFVNQMLSELLKIPLCEQYVLFGKFMFVIHGLGWQWNPD